MIIELYQRGVNMKTTQLTFKDFIKSVSKTTKLIILITAPLIISLFAGGLYLQIHMLIHGYSSEIARLSDELIKCCADCLNAVFVPAFFIELSGTFQ